MGIEELLKEKGVPPGSGEVTPYGDPGGKRAATSAAPVTPVVPIASPSVTPFSTIVMHPTTGEIRTITSQNDYLNLPQEWKRTAPTIDQLREARYTGEDANVVGVVPSVRYGESNLVKLDYTAPDGNPEYVAKADMELLTPKQQRALSDMGTEAFNQVTNKVQRAVDFNALTNPVVRLSTGEYVPREAFNALSPKQQKVLKSIGVEEFNRSITIMENRAALSALQSPTVKLSTGEYVTRKSFDELTPTQQRTLLRVGVDRFLGTKWGKELVGGEMQFPAAEESLTEQADTSGLLSRLEPYATAEPMIGTIIEGQERPSTTKYDVVQAYQDKKISDYELTQLGYDATEIASIAAVMDKLKPFKREEGYNIQSAYSKGAVTKDELLQARFDAEDVDALKPTATASEWKSLQKGAMLAGTLSGAEAESFINTAKDKYDLSSSQVEQLVAKAQKATFPGTVIDVEVPEEERSAEESGKADWSSILQGIQGVAGQGRKAIDSKLTEIQQQNDLSTDQMESLTRYAYWQNSSATNIMKAGLEKALVKYEHLTPEEARMLSDTAEGLATFFLFVGTVVKSEGKLPDTYAKGYKEKGKAPKQLTEKDVIKAAKDSGVAAKKLEQTVTKLDLEKITGQEAKLAPRYAQEAELGVVKIAEPVTSPLFDSVTANRLQVAAQRSRIADEKLADIMEGAGVSVKNASVIALKTGRPNMEFEIRAAAQAKSDLAEAWKEVDRYDVGSIKYVEALQKAQIAKTKLDNTYKALQESVKPRVKLDYTTDPEVSRALEVIDGKITAVEAELKRLESPTNPKYKWAKDNPEMSDSKTFMEEIKSAKSELSNLVVTKENITTVAKVQGRMPTIETRYVLKFKGGGSTEIKTEEVLAVEQESRSISQRASEESIAKYKSEERKFAEESTAAWNKARGEGFTGFRKGTGEATFKKKPSSAGPEAQPELAATGKAKPKKLMELEDWDVKTEPMEKVFQKTKYAPPEPEIKSGEPTRGSPRTRINEPQPETQRVQPEKIVVTKTATIPFSREEWEALDEATKKDVLAAIAANMPEKMIRELANKATKRAKAISARLAELRAEKELKELAQQKAQGRVFGLPDRKKEAVTVSAQQQEELVSAVGGVQPQINISTKEQQKESVVVRPYTKNEPGTGIETGIQDQAGVKTDVVVSPRTGTRIQVVPKSTTATLPRTMTAVQVVPVIKTATAVQIKPIVKTPVRTTVKTSTPTPPRGGSGSEKPKPPFILLPPSGAGTLSKAVPAGSITWAMGSLNRGKGLNKRKMPQWWYLPPPYTQTDAIPLQRPPIGARFTSSINPYETIQIIGVSGATVPDLVEKDLGWADIQIIRGKEIKFKAGGQMTNVGTRDASTGKGISLNGEGGGMEDVLDVDEGQEYMLPEPRPSSRTTPIKSKLTRSQSKRKSRMSSLDYMTTMKGFDAYNSRTTGVK